MAARPLPPAARRLRWKSRRGWLELDLLLAAFWERHGGALSAAEQAQLAQWLALTDENLWALLASPPAGGEPLAQKIRPPANTTIHAQGGTA